MSRSNKKLAEKARKLRQEVDNSMIIATFADLVSWEESNKYTMNRPRIAKPLLKQLQDAGLYRDL